MAIKQLRLPDSELEILHVLWDRETSTAREIREIIEKKKNEPIAHSTIVTLLQRLEKKGHIQRTGEKQGKAFVYRATIEPERAQKHFIKKYLARFIGNDPLPLFSWLIESGDLSVQDISQVREMLDDLERKKSEEHHDE